MTRSRPIFTGHSPARSIQFIRSKAVECNLDNGDMTLPSKDAGHGIHHPVYGVKMKEACDAAGVECRLLIPGTSTSETYKDTNAFLMAKLLK